MERRVERLLAEIRACRICVEAPDREPLGHPPRPVAVLSDTARIAICGQAPGVRVHASGIPFTDPSGDRLREWMGVDETVFYDRSKVAIIPMGFCFPGLDEKGGDLPPRPECARTWRQKVFDAMPQLELLLVIGIYAQKWHLGPLREKSLTETVANWRSIRSQTGSPCMVPLPHPSWRNNAWIRKNPWFASELLPELKKMIQERLNA